MSENAERASIASLLKRLDAKDDTIDRLTEQRDALLAACEGVLSALDSITLECRAFHHSPRERHQIDATCPPEEYARAARNVARAAIAKVGGGND